MAVNKYLFVEEELERRKSQTRLRNLRSVTPLSAVEVQIDGRRMLNFCSNDYLGLSKHPLLRKRAIEFTERYGTGSTASRLICGSYDCFKKAEERLAVLKGVESALILNSGFQANVSILPALTDRNSLILSDWLNHNSIVQGCLLSRCQVHRFRHNDVLHLRELLEENCSKGFSRILIVSESVFSVDGDRADIQALALLAQEFQAFLVVDEAHATGVLGERGMGLSFGQSVDLTIGTFGKACGSFGAYVTCSERLRDYFVNCCAGFVYTTALPPSVIGSIDAALELIPGMEKEREELHRKANRLRSVLQAMCWDTAESSTQIIPVIVGSEKEALRLSGWLEENGVLAMALRPPTVPEGQSRIRLALTACHTEDEIDSLIHLFKKWGRYAAG